MAHHTAVICWERGDAPYLDRQYSRAHTWSFDGGLTVPASSSPHVVPVPLSTAEHIDPEEAFVAALASCHMLWFLDCAARAGFVVDSYRDEAVGTMGRDLSNKLMITHVLLRPHIQFSGSALPSEEEVEALHHRAHESCFLANSVKSIVETRGTWARAAS